MNSAGRVNPRRGGRGQQLVALPPPGLRPSPRSRPPGLTKCRCAPLSPALLLGRGSGERRSAYAVSGALRSPRLQGRPAGSEELGPLLFPPVEGG